MNNFILLLAVSVSCLEKSLVNVIALSGEHSNITGYAENGEKHNSGITDSPSSSLLTTQYSIHFSEENDTLIVQNIPYLFPDINCRTYEVCLYTNRSQFTWQDNSSLHCLDHELFANLHSSCKNSRHSSKSPGSCSIEQHFSDYLDIAEKESHTVIFSHVSSGFYCVRLKCIDQLGIHIPRELNERPFPVVNKKYMDRDDYASCLKTIVRTYNRSSEVEVRLKVKSSCLRKNLRFVLNLQKKNDKKTYVTEACTTVTVKDQNDETWYTFKDLAPRNYSLQILAVDPRCFGDLKKQECTTRYEDDIIIVGDSPDVPEPLNSQGVCCQVKDYLLIGFMCSVAFVLIIVATMFYKRKLWCFQPPADRSGLFGYETSVVKIHKKVQVLLLHANDDEALRKQVHHFCHILDSVGFCEVSDLFDDRIYDAIATHGESIITAMLSNPHVQVVVVTSKQAAKVQKGILGGAELEDDNNGPMFDLYVKALKTVMIMVSGNVESYKRIHLVRFSDITPSDDKLSFITPFRCYAVPRNLRNLLCHLHGFADQDTFEWDHKLGEDFCKEWSKVTRPECCANNESSDYLLTAC